MITRQFKCSASEIRWKGVVFVFHGCLPNCHKHSNLNEHKFIISQFLWVKSLFIELPDYSQGVGWGCVSAEVQGPLLSSLVAGRIQFLGLSSSVSRGCSAAVHYIAVWFLSKRPAGNRLSFERLT